MPALTLPFLEIWRSGKLLRALALLSTDTFTTAAKVVIMSGTGTPSGRFVGAATTDLCLFLAADASSNEDVLWVLLPSSSSWVRFSTLSDLQLAPATDVTITGGGAATLTGAVHTIRGASGAADNLDTISGMTAAEIAILVTGAEAITYRDASVGGGNISTQRDASIVTATGDIVMAVLSGTVVRVVPLMVQAGVPTSASAPGSTDAGGVVASTSASIRTAPFNTYTAPAAASATGVAAREEDNVAGGVWVGAFTSPAIPRNVTITFEAAWAGGDVTVSGTDQFDAAITEVIADNPGSLVSGVKVFKTVTGAVNQSVGAGGVNHGATIGFGNALGLTYLPSAAVGSLTCDGVGEAATWNATYGSVTPTTAPNAARNYAAMYPYGASHSHDGGSHTHAHATTHTHQS
jgi:hypothetical protein